MNLVGHVLAASRDHEDPRALLGSMLPDLASIAGQRLLPPTCPRVQAGVRHHHAIDAVFHGLPRFAALRAEARVALLDRGVSKGPREAVAHAGVELLLDGAYIERREAVRAYDAAAQASRELSFDEAGWTSRESFLILTGRLADPSLPRHYGDAGRVAEMLVRVLAGRPRLRPDDREALAIRDVLAGLRDRVFDEADALLRDVAGPGRASVAPPPP